MTLSVSVLVVNFNGGDCLIRCLEALEPQLGPADEVLVVDNASTDGSASLVESKFAGTRVIRNTTNVGFARANNMALRAARGDLILLLNPDVIVEESALSKARRYMGLHLDVSILGPKVLLPNGRVDPASHRSFKTPSTYFYKALGLTRMFPRHPQLGRYYLSYRDENETGEVDSIVGAFFLIRRTTVDQVGLLDERFFMYCEDEDWCWRVRQAGGRVVYHPEIKVRHEKGGSTRQVRLRMIYHWHRSLLLYHSKNIAANYPLLVNLAVYTGILAAMVARLAIAPLRARSRALALD